MKKLLLFIFIIFIFFSCKKEFNKSSIQTYSTSDTKYDGILSFNTYNDFTATLQKVALLNRTEGLR